MRPRNARKALERGFNDFWQQEYQCVTAPSVPGSLEKGVRLFQGEGVSGVVYERMSAFFTFAALTPTPLSLRELFQSQRDKHCSR